jgi:hypothetical protein
MIELVLDHDRQAARLEQQREATKFLPGNCEDDKISCRFRGPRGPDTITHRLVAVSNFTVVPLAREEIEEVLERRTTKEGARGCSSLAIRLRKVYC